MSRILKFQQFNPVVNIHNSALTVKLHSNTVYSVLTVVLILVSLLIPIREK